MWSFMSSKIRVWHSRLWCCCVFGIVSKRSSRFITEVETTKHLDQCHQLHHSFLLCQLKCYENVHTMITKKVEHLWHCNLHVFHNIFLAFWWSCLDIFFKSATLHSEMLHCFGLQVPSSPLQPWVACGTPNAYPLISRSSSLTSHASIASCKLEAF
jgi:hypothetical protein